MILNIPQIVLLLFAGAVIGALIARSYYAALFRATVAEFLSTTAAAQIADAGQMVQVLREQRYAMQRGERVNAWMDRRAQRAALTERLEEAV